MGKIGRALIALIAVSVVAVPPAWSRDVDLALILAIDVSGSVNAERWELQRRGYEAAFKSPEVLQSITSGPRKARPEEDWVGDQAGAPARVTALEVPWANW